jgi:hypothetical protein
MAVLRSFASGRTFDDLDGRDDDGGARGWQPPNVRVVVGDGQGAGTPRWARCASMHDDASRHLMTATNTPVSSRCRAERMSTR